MEYRCPGADSLRGNVTITEKICPECGRTIEMFSNEPKAVCVCGFVAQNGTLNCISWCAYARECVGAEVFDQFTKKGG